MKWTIFRKHFAVTAGITTAFAALGLVASLLVIEAERQSDRPRDRSCMRQGPGAFSAHLLDTLVQQQSLTPEDALATVQRIHAGNFKLELYSEDNFPRNLLNLSEMPAQPYQTVWLRRNRFSPPVGEVVRLAGSSPKYLLITPDALRGPPQQGLPRIFFINFIALVIAVLAAAAVSMFLLYRSIGAKAKLVDRILTDIRMGNLKARFPVGRLDEVGQFMQKFNLMADEIERLVERLKLTERRRTHLLQELAHDLRTPVASLKNFVEGLQVRADSIRPEHRDQMLAYSLKEIDYLERLVEDLLFLSQVSEPGYVAAVGTVSLSEIAEEELGRVAARFPTIAVHRPKNPPSVMVGGDVHLLRRLLRNALDNAFAFARSEVALSIDEESNRALILIRDDGPGLSGEALAAYGEKRTTRLLSEGVGGRISVGLGSVIIKAVVQAHGGNLRVMNSASGGAEVYVDIPLASSDNSAEDKDEDDLSDGQNASPI